MDGWIVGGTGDIFVRRGRFGLPLSMGDFCGAGGGEMTAVGLRKTTPLDGGLSDVWGKELSPRNSILRGGYVRLLTSREGYHPPFLSPIRVLHLAVCSSQHSPRHVASDCIQRFAFCHNPSMAPISTFFFLFVVLPTRLRPFSTCLVPIVPSSILIRSAHGHVSTGRNELRPGVSIEKHGSLRISDVVS